MAGLLGSLGIIVGLLNLPLFYSSQQVGWTSQRTSEPIALQEISSEEKTSSEDKQETATHSEDEPPPTQHTSPSTEASDGSGTSQTNGSGSRKKKKRLNESSSPKMMAALEMHDRRPKIKGGTGALYLQIHYPEAARQQGIEGKLKLEFTVDQEGAVHAIEVKKSLHPLCDSAAVRALRSVEFRPATHEGSPIPVRMTLPIRFQLRPNDGPLHSHRQPPSGR